MKWTIATATAVALLATPALAATRTHHGRTYNQVPYGEAYARAQYDEYSDASRFGVGAPQPDVVISGDKVLGQDPDPTIRTQMRQQGDVSAY